MYYVSTCPWALDCGSCWLVTVTLWFCCVANISQETWKHWTFLSQKPNTHELFQHYYPQQSVLTSISVACSCRQAHCNVMDIQTDKREIIPVSACFCRWHRDIYHQLITWYQIYITWYQTYSNISSSNTHHQLVNTEQFTSSCINHNKLIVLNEITINSCLVYVSPKE